MAKHYLDPKQTEGPYDVNIVPAIDGYMNPSFCWNRQFFATEAEALTAARKAAGYETEECDG